VWRRISSTASRLRTLCSRTRRYPSIVIARHGSSGTTSAAHISLVRSIHVNYTSNVVSGKCLTPGYIKLVFPKVQRLHLDLRELGLWPARAAGSDSRLWQRFLREAWDEFIPDRYCTGHQGQQEDLKEPGPIDTSDREDAETIGKLILDTTTPASFYQHDKQAFVKCFRLREFVREAEAAGVEVRCLWRLEVLGTACYVSVQMRGKEWQPSLDNVPLIKANICQTVTLNTKDNILRVKCGDGTSVILLRTAKDLFEYHSSRIYH